VAWGLGVELREETIDLGALFRTFLRNWWVLVLGVVAGGLIAVFTIDVTDPTYSSTSKLFVQGGSDAAGFSASNIEESRRISQLYGDLATTRPILEAVSASDDVPFSVEELRSKIRVKETRSFIEITVTDLDPVVAATVANVTAVTLIGELADRQIAQIAQFQDSLEQLGLGGDSAILAAQAANLPVLSLAEIAVPATTPIGTNIARIGKTTLYMLIGLFAAFGVVVVKSALDDRIMTEDEFVATTGFMCLGAVPRYHKSEHGEPLLMNGLDRHHPAAEAYYIIRANVDFASKSDDPVRSVLVTGPGPGEGKSTIASNLAVAFANEGNSVIIVDTDLRRPVQHLLFRGDHPNERGVTDVLNGGVTLDDALQTTGLDGLKILSAGTLDEDPDRLLRSKPFEEMKTRLAEMADVVVYDSPPVLVVSDPLLLSESVDLTILVVGAGSTNRREARRGAEAQRRSSGWKAASLSES
jgi:polysaccharide biosynthesis transport protein